MEKEVLVDDMWTPFKELQRIVENAISKPSLESYDEMVKCLQSQRQNFLSLMKNSPKNEMHRQEINKGCNEGIELPGSKGKTVLPREIVSEAIILSDMYNLNEYLALDLLGTAQVQMPNYPGVARGVVAVLLYYDGRRSLAWTLRTLAEAGAGNMWQIETSRQVEAFVAAYNRELIADGIVPTILGVLESLDVNAEIELLQKNRALGPPRYHQQVLDVITSTRSALAETIYLYSAQTGLPKEPALALIGALRKIKPLDNPPPSHPGLDSVTMALFQAFLYVVDMTLINRHDSEDLEREHPLLKENGALLSALAAEFSTASDSGSSKTALPGIPGTSATPSSSSADKWADRDLHCLATMAWALAVSNIRLVPRLIPPSVNLENPDVIMENAIERKVFTYLHDVFLNSSCLYSEQEFYQRRIHNLFVDFIIQMPQKVKEMRLKAEETDKTLKAYISGGIEPPKTLINHFEQVLLCLAKFYSKDKMNLQLGYDFWCQPSDYHPVSFPYRAQHKQSTLFSFVVNTGESLLMMLFVPYIKMLTALSMFPQGAQMCYAYLRDNPEGVLKPPSWAHFFSTLNRYLNNLKQETLSSTDTFYRQRNYSKGISPHELQGLQAVLDLIKTVASNDVSSGEALCQNTAWSCINVLVGLVTCPIDLTLKGRILETLAALAKSPITSVNIWHAIEQAQLIQTMPSTSTYAPKGILNDVEEGESRNEEYPVSRGWLALMYSLVDNKPLPRLLGSPSRCPGLDPYLHFLVQHILLRAPARRYRRPEEKWALCDLGLSVVVSLLVRYDPTAPDSVTDAGSTQANPHPGYHIMVSLCSQTELLRLLLDIIDEGTRQLDSYGEFSGKESLERAQLHSLRCLEHTLQHQKAFMNLLSQAGSSMLLPGMSNLILAVNPRSNKPDHLLNIAKFVTYGSNWDHCLAAVRVLRLAGDAGPTPRSHLLAIVTSTPALRLSIRHGFVCLMEAEEVSPTVVATKHAVAELLLSALRHGVPNVAHYLLGFDLNKEIRKTVFEQPGVLGMPRTCLHSLISQLNLSLVYRWDVAPQIIVGYYRLIHALAANPRTSDPILRFLRSSQDFLQRHLSAMPFPATGPGYELEQMAWLLKAVSIEMRVTASSKQLYQLAGLVKTFTGESSNGNNDSQVNINQGKEQLILHLIKSIEFHIEPRPPPRLDYFELDAISKVMEECEVNENGIKLVDEEEVKKLLDKNFAMVKSKSSASQRKVILEEMERIIEFVKSVNEQRQITAATIRLLDGWRQAVEVMFSVATADALPLDKKIFLLINIIHELLAKVGCSGAIEAEKALIISDCILVLSVTLRACCGGALSNENEPVDHHHLSSSPSPRLIIDTNMHKITSIVSHLVKWILESGSSNQKIRVNLYSGLVNMVKVGSGNTLSSDVVSKDSSQYVSVLDRSGRVGHAPALEMMLQYRDRLLDMLCHDTAVGHDVTKMIALSVLDMVVCGETKGTWASHLSSRGYFKFLIESIMSSDSELTMLLSPQCKSLRPLYVYESKMALLCRVASTDVGAELLLEQNVLSCISALGIFNRHPEIAPNIPNRTFGDEDEFIPNLASRYLQILSPALYLCDALLSSLGVENQAAVAQALRFVLGLGETVSQVLRAGSPFHPLPFLQELAQVTGVIARATNQEVWKDFPSIDEEPTIDVLAGSARFHRFKSLMLSLVSRFVISESLLKEIESEARHRPDPVSPENQRAPVITFLQIAANLVLYARNLVSSTHSDRRICNVIFQPALSDISSSYDRREGGVLLQEATLGVIVQQLEQAVCHHAREKGNLDMATRRLHSLSDMTTSNIKQYLPEALADVTEADECRRLATKILSEQVAVKQHELDLSYAIIEHCLFIIWAHLDFFMLVGLSTKTFGLPKAAKLVPTMEYDVTWGVTVEDINHLKQGLLSVFNDTFSKTLVSTAQDMPASEKGFLEALLRRIKKLIQFVPNS